jgi:hypothetical protein
VVLDAGTCKLENNKRPGLPPRHTTSIRAGACGQTEEVRKGKSALGSFFLMSVGG